jgi:hypothetical protein
MEIHNETWDKLTQDQRLAAAVVIFEKIFENAREGGSFRKLISDRLGFLQKDYPSLYMAGGMAITNELEL